MVQDYERLGVFYLGRPYDLERGRTRDTPLLYDSKDLVTHAVCVGMTGSGKTGLCVALIEEAAIDGIPAIVIDPKGDLANLLLTFPELRAEDFAPWINQEDARREGVEPSEYASRQAAMWKDGLAKWDQDGARIARLRAAADFAVYTPASDAGLKVSALKSFSAPAAQVREDRELLRERISATATSLLALLGINADPVRSREHILISNLLDAAWRAGRDVEIGSLIQQIQEPPMTRVGVLEMESFYPSKERFDLAMSLNNLLASPGFEAWMEGEPLDIGRMLHTAEGKPRVAIFSIAHLSDAERMFFVSLLLNETVSWMRTQSGTTSLRALLYMDEIFGYFPPVANPPSKAPLLTLLKQARAYGLGVVLATQNPVDLDYKGLANAGTWFLGRLQTERDKMRVLEGLEGAAATAGAAFDRGRMERILAGLGKRVFLLNNVHEDAPEIFETRWTLSYLRGPLTRPEIRTLMQQGRTAVAVPPPAAAATPARPVLPPEIPQAFLAPRGGEGELTYRPMLLGAAEVRFADAKAGVDAARSLTLMTPLKPAPAATDWSESEIVELTIEELEREPGETGAFLTLPPAAAKAKSYAEWTRLLANWLFASQKLELLKSPALGATSQPGETERDFRVRVGQAAREKRDLAAEDLRRKYAPRLAAVQDRIRRAEQAVAREAEQAQQQKMQSAIAIGTGLLGAFLGRKVVSRSTLSTIGTAARTAGRSYKESQDVGRARENVEALHGQLAELEAQFRADTEALEARLDPATETLEAVAIRPRKVGISVKLVTLVWAPHRRQGGEEYPAW